MPNQKQDTPVFNVGKAETQKDTNRALSFHTTYDIFGNVKRATDANGMNIISEYDNANRIKKRCYTKPNIVTTATECYQLTEPQMSADTPTVYFTYDGKYYGPNGEPYTATGLAKGSLTQVRNGISTSQTTIYDDFGRAKKYQQITDGNTYTSEYTYNFAGALIEEKYPNGQIVKNEFNSNGDLSRVFGTVNSTASEKTYVNSFSYTTAGGISRMKLGNGRWETAKFNDRLQMTELGLGNSATDASLWKVAFDYGELSVDGLSVNQTQNTGNIARQTISFAGLTNPFVQTFRYDSLYRLKEAAETNQGATTTNWTQNFTYDRFGNRTAFAQNLAGIASSATPAMIPATNRFEETADLGYDKNGNIIKDAYGAQARRFIFNGENKQTEIRDANIAVSPSNPDANLIGRYFYDGEGKRVKKQTANEITIFVYSGGKLIQEYSTTLPEQPSTNYTTSDHLGSPRIITDELGQIKARRDFMPFGEELLAGVGGRTSDTGQKYAATKDEIRQKFTGYQKDKEAELDFAEARMYNNQHGRFTAVDPLLASGNSANPQTFNRYVYVTNNPIIITDPTGLFGDYYDRKGNYLASDGEKDGRIYFADYHHTDKEGAVWVYTNSIEETTPFALQVLRNWATRSIPSRTPSFLDSFPTNPWTQAASGAIKGPPNFFINSWNFASNVALNTRNGIYVPSFDPNPLAIEPFSLSPGIEENFGKGFEYGTGFAGPVFAAPFRAGSSLSIFSRGNILFEEKALVGGAGGSNGRQRVIDAIIKEDFPNLKFTAKPTFNPEISYFGRAVSGNNPKLYVGRASQNFSSRATLRDTLVHEELHHRFWRKGLVNHHGNPAIDARLTKTINRYFRFRGW